MPDSPPSTEPIAFPMPFKIAFAVLVIGLGIAYVSMENPSAFEGIVSAPSGSGRPTEDEVRQLIRERNPIRYIVPGPPTTFTYGTTLEGNDFIGIKGSSVYPVRVLFHGPHSDSTYDLYFWRDPFGTWQATVDDGRRR